MDKRFYKSKFSLIDFHVTKETRVLDVGFWGQGVGNEDINWPHLVISKKGCSLYGIDLDYDEDRLLSSSQNYSKQSAETFSLNTDFDIIFAGDLIEHLSNPGLFLNSCAKHLSPQGKLIITTPNCYNLFNMTEIFTKREPSVNPDHTFYFNEKTLIQFFKKNSWEIIELSGLYSLGCRYKRTLRKRIVDCLYWLSLRLTDKFIQTLVVVAQPAKTPVSRK